MKKYSVYLHKFPDNKYYIGLTKQNVKRRWGCNGKGYKGQPVYCAIQQFGWDNIEHRVVAENLEYHEAQELEKRLIYLCDSINNGYNAAKGGGLGGTEWRTFIYNDVVYTAKELVDMSCHNLNGHDITNRINEHGWSVEQAINKPKGRKKYKI